MRVLFLTWFSADKNTNCCHLTQFLHFFFLACFLSLFFLSFSLASFFSNQERGGTCDRNLASTRGPPASSCCYLIGTVITLGLRKWQPNWNRKRRGNPLPYSRRCQSRGSSCRALQATCCSQTETQTEKKNKQKEEIVTLLWDWVNCQSSWFTQQNRARAKKESQTVSHFTLALNPSSHSISSRKPTKLSWQQHRYRVKIDKKEFIDKTKNSSSSPFSDFFFSSFFLSFLLSFFLSLFFFFSLLTVDCCCQKKQKRKKKKEEKRSQKMPRGVPVTLLCYVHRSVTEVGNRRRRWVGGRVGGGWRHYVRITGRVALVATIPCEWWASWRRPCADCTSETAAEGTTPATSAETRPCGRRNGPSSPATAARWVEWVGRETAATSPVPSATMAEL